MTTEDDEPEKEYDVSSLSSHNLGVIKESMIEEYVMDLQRRKKLKNDITRQIMNFLILQFLLKNIQPNDFKFNSHGKILNIVLGAGISTEESTKIWTTLFENPISDLRRLSTTSASLLKKKLSTTTCIAVVPIAKDDFGKMLNINNRNNMNNMNSMNSMNNMNNMNNMNTMNTMNNGGYHDESQKTSMTSYDLWIKYLENHQSMKKEEDQHSSIGESKK